MAAAFATGSAINSTLFATTRLAHLVAKDGEFPAVLDHRNSNEVPDRALIALGSGAALLAAFGSLSSLVEAASLTFLFTFSVVCGLAWKKNSGLRAITAAGAITSAMATIALVYRLATETPLALAFQLLGGGDPPDLIAGGPAENPGPAAIWWHLLRRAASARARTASMASATGPVGTPRARLVSLVSGVPASILRHACSRARSTRRSASASSLVASQRCRAWESPACRASTEPAKIRAGSPCGTSTEPAACELALAHPPDAGVSGSQEEPLDAVEREPRARPRRRRAAEDAGEDERQAGAGRGAQVGGGAW